MMSAAPSDEERAAVDELLGPPDTGWVGGERAAGRRAAVRSRGPCGPGPARPPAPGAPRPAVPRRVDQRGRPDLRLPTPDRASGRGVRGRDVLRHVQRRTAAEVGGPRLRRPRLPHRRRHALHGAGGFVRSRRDRRSGRRHHVGPEPVPGDVRAGPRRARPARRARCGRLVVRQRVGRTGPEPARGWRARPGVRATDRPRRRLRPADLGRGARIGAPLAAPGGTGRPVVDRRLPGPRRLRGLATSPRARSRRGRPGGHRREAHGPWGSGVPDGGQVEGRRRAARAAALLHLQRRRVRAGDVQGSRGDGAGSVRGDRGAHDRRLRDGLRPGLHLHPR